MNLYVVRAEFGTYTNHFLKGGYVAIGWLGQIDLMHVYKAELYKIYKEAYPSETSNIVIGQQVGQIARFLLDIHTDDYVILPAADTDYIYYGTLNKGESVYSEFEEHNITQRNYYLSDCSDGCPFMHRRRVTWHKEPVLRSLFSIPFQNSIRSSLTVFKVDHLKTFLETIGRPDLIPRSDRVLERDYYTTVLSRLLELHDKEFEILITYLLSALGFEGSEHQGKVGDGGVDVTGEFNVSGLAKVKVFVQVKRYKLGTKINHNVVKSLRQSIPFGGQGAFIATCDFQNVAEQTAVEPGFPRIGLINGKQLGDILAEHWNDIWLKLPDEFKDKLNFKLGLVVS